MTRGRAAPADALRTTRESAPSRPPSAGAVAVRAALPADLHAVVALRLALLHEHRDNPIYRRIRADAFARAHDLFARQLASATEVTLLAESPDSAEPVGILRCAEATGSPLLHPARYGYVSSVYVVPPFRRAGVLRALLDAAALWCEDRALTELRLHNVPENDGANQAWDALGFEVVEVLRVRTLRGGER